MADHFDSVAVSVTIKGREYRLVTDINPYTPLNAKTIMAAMETVLRRGVSADGKPASLLSDPAFRKAMKERNEEIA